MALLWAQNSEASNYCLLRDHFCVFRKDLQITEANTLNACFATLVKVYNYANVKTMSVGEK